MRGRLIAVIVAGFLIGALAGAAVLLVATRRGGPPVQTIGTALIGGPFTLVGTDGKTGHRPGLPRALHAGLLRLHPLPRHLPGRASGDVGRPRRSSAPRPTKVVPIFITLDPERDTPQAMADYVKSFGPRFRRPDRLARGRSPQPPRPIAWPIPKFQKIRQAGDYSIDHSALVYLMGNERRICHAFFLWHAAPTKWPKICDRYL